MKISELRQQPVRTFVTSKGDTVKTFLTDGQALSLMEHHAKKGAVSEFGRSLLDSALSKYGLSERQLPWFHKLALDLLPASGRPDYVATPKPTLTLDLGVIRGMMDKAGERLKFPKIRFMMDEGKIQIARAGERSRTPGAIMVTDGGPYGANTFYGRVHTDGTWEPARGGCPQWVVEALKGLAENPAGYAALYGKRTGQCCFCGLGLTDGRSVAVGYGPICAGNYGLPWGEVNANDTPLETVEVSSLVDELPSGEGEVPVGEPEALEATVQPWKDVVVEKVGPAPWL